MDTGDSLANPPIDPLHPSYSGDPEENFQRLLEHAGGDVAYPAAAGVYRAFCSNGPGRDPQWTDAAALAWIGQWLEAGGAARSSQQLGAAAAQESARPRPAAASLQPMDWEPTHLRPARCNVRRCARAGGIKRPRAFGVAAGRAAKRPRRARGRQPAAWERPPSSPLGPQQRQQQPQQQSQQQQRQPARGQRGQGMTAPAPMPVDPRPPLQGRRGRRTPAVPTAHDSPQLRPTDAAAGAA